MRILTNIINMSNFGGGAECFKQASLTLPQYEGGVDA